MGDYTLALSDAELLRYRMMAERARVEEADAWRTAGIVPGARVADIGCGPGATLVAMAAVVGESGAVTGVDADPAAVSVAQRLIAQSQVGNAQALVAPADASGLEPGTFDVAVMRHVLAHNGRREHQLVQHLAELVRPGGCVYLVDTDLTAFRFLRADPDLVDLIERYPAFHAARGNDPQVGLRLAELLRDAGLDVLEHVGTYNILAAPVGMRPPVWAARDSMVAEGHATAEDVVRWQAAFERLDDQADRPTLFMPAFRATGQRPL